MAPIIYCRVHNSQLLVLILSQINPAHALPSYSFMNLPTGPPNGILSTGSSPARSFHMSWPYHSPKQQSVSTADHQYHHNSLHVTLLAPNQRNVTGHGMCSSHSPGSLIGRWLLQYKQDASGKKMTVQALIVTSGRCCIVRAQRSNPVVSCGCHYNQPSVTCNTLRCHRRPGVLLVHPCAVPWLSGGPLSKRDQSMWGLWGAKAALGQTRFYPVMPLTIASNKQYMNTIGTGCSVVRFVYQLCDNRPGLAWRSAVAGRTD
jgi:hypothetical protein